MSLCQKLGKLHRAAGGDSELVYSMEGVGGKGTNVGTAARRSVPAACRVYTSVCVESCDVVSSFCLFWL